MTEYEHIKQCYIFIVQFAMSINVEYEQLKLLNEMVHKFCEQFVETGNYSDKYKQLMKYYLKVVKEILSKEIEEYGRNT